jgi:hypothetical protein
MNPELMFQDDASASWRKRKKHLFILSYSGKPIYSRLRKEQLRFTIPSFLPVRNCSFPLSRREGMTCYAMQLVGMEMSIS